ncbi:DUF3570 domain-containing protein [Glaciecola sp. MF2-115]|uniref:DUF3570 domain-containing protein n=1 Tax=Glaciecola sp. MF2-115 TaxID=3384827 RepID=UPI00399F4AE4
MQLSKSKKIATLLAGATCTLLNTGVQAQEAKSENDWKFDTAILYYGETDRVSLFEGVFSASKDFGDQHIFNTKIVVDTLTGASATGAVPQPSTQTFTRPSGNGQYTVSPNELPLDDTFRDTRLQLSANWSQPIQQDTRLNFGGNISREYDYLSVGANVSAERDFYNKNTTALFGLSYQFDSIDPVGGRPIPLSTMVVDTGQFGAGEVGEEAFEDAFKQTRIDGSDDKSTIDALFGLTQVINRRMLVQLNYSYSNSSGYLNDPYKLLSIVNSNGETQSIVHENRPDSRAKHSVYAQTKYAFDNAVADVSYRFASDDWEIQSHTIDSRLRYKLNESDYIQPHLRYYQQSEADFYRPYLNEGEVLPTFASADYRLGEMTAITVGLKYGHKMNNGHEWGVRAEYYQQDPKNAGYEDIGVLASQDLYPSVKAFILQFSYKF